MNKHSKGTIAVIIFFLATTITLHGQVNNLVKYEIGLAVGTLIYQGDLAPSALGSYKTMKPVIALQGSRLLSYSLAVRANLFIGGIKGDESKYAEPAYRRQRNFNFHSPVMELTGQLVWNPLGRNYEDKGFSPYIAGGAGFSVLKIKRDWSNVNAEVFGTNTAFQAGLATDQQHSLPRVIPVVPVGVGFRYGISPRIALNVETSYRFTTTDYLDGFSAAANPGKKDSYQTHTIGLIYRIGKKNMLGCPVIRQ